MYNIIKAKQGSKMVKMETNSFAIYVDRDSTQVKVYFDKDYDALVTIPPFTYYKEVRIFHKNGVLMESGNAFSVHLSILAFGASMTIRVTL